jgi:uncharacterized membrane protein YdjX (TVP38/TMEM64 family)
VKPTAEDYWLAFVASVLGAIMVACIGLATKNALHWPMWTWMEGIAVESFGAWWYTLDAALRRRRSRLGRRSTWRECHTRSHGR